MRLTWKDRSRGETRYEVRRTGAESRAGAQPHDLHRPQGEGGKALPLLRPAVPRQALREGADACASRCPRREAARRRRPAGAGARRRRVRRQPGDRRLPDLPEATTRGTRTSRRRPSTPRTTTSARSGRWCCGPTSAATASTASRSSASRSRSRSCRSRFEVADESDPGPVPDAARRAGRGRRRPPRADAAPGRLQAVRALRRRARRARAGTPTAARRWDLRSNALRPERWTSADAAGLPILPGLARRDEADSGAINHALRITVPTTQKAYIHPATHWASSNTDPDQPPMGLRVRLKASYDISGLTRPGASGRAGAEDLRRAGRRQRRLSRACTSPARSTRAGTTTTSTGSRRSRRARSRRS